MMNTRWQLQPIFGSYLLVVVLVVVLLGLLWVRPTFGSLSLVRRRWMMGIRALIAVLLLVAMLRPTAVTTETNTQKSIIPILFDVSRSMNHKDGDGGDTRWAQQQQILKQSLPLLQDLGDHLEAKLIAYAGQTQDLSLDSDSLQALSADGGRTDIGNAIAATLQAYVGQRIAAVVLIGDGAQRGRLNSTAPQQSARQLSRQAVPLFTIALGRSQDKTQARDVAIENLQDEYSVFVKNEFSLRVGVRIQGYDNQPISVKVTIEDSDGELAVLGPQTVAATSESQIVMTDFSFHPEKPGQYKLHVEAEEQPGESIDNNKMTSFLDVRDGGLRVLLLTSNLLGEEKKLIIRSLKDSRDVELDYEIINLLNRDQWPLDAESFLDLEQYDVFILGDLDAGCFRTENWIKLESLVDGGRGLMMYGGYHSFGPGGYSETALSKMLPVQMNRFEIERDPTQATRHERHLKGEVRMLPTTSHTVTFLASDEDNRDAWQNLPALNGANRFDRLRDQCEVLAVTPDGDPLLVAASYVGGRVLAFAGDSTFRWWRHGFQDQHKRFWRQCVLWLARRDKQEANSVFIDLSQRRSQTNARISFVTGLTDELGNTVPDAVLRATVIHPNGAVDMISLGDSRSDASNGQTGFIVNTTEPGEYRLHVEALEGQQVVASAYRDFVVVQHDVELSDPAANPGLMDMLARITEGVGGRPIAPEELRDVLKGIQSAPSESEIESETRWQLGDTPTDAWSYFLVLVGLLSTDWYFRKRWGLV